MPTFSDFSSFRTYEVYRLHLNTMPDPNILFNLSSFRQTATPTRREFRPDLTRTIPPNPPVPMNCTSRPRDDGMMLVIRICCLSIQPLLVYVIDQSTVSVLFRILTYGDLGPVIQHELIPFFPVWIRVDRLDTLMHDTSTGPREFHVPTDSEIQIVDRMSLFSNPELSGRSPGGNSWLDQLLDEEIDRVEKDWDDNDETDSDGMDNGLVFVEEESE